jgi:hypothetical protein
MNAMKVIFPVFLVTILTSSNVAASAFTIQDVHNEILGSLSVYQGVNVFYDIRSTTAISFGFTDPAPPDPFPHLVSSTADGPYVAVSAEGRVAANAAAISTIDFIPTFDGAAPEVLFVGPQATEGWGFVPGFGDLPIAGWTITDMTTNALVATDFLGLAHTFKPLVYGTYGDLGDQYAWDSTHTYQLRLEVTAGADGGLETGSLSTNMFSVNVPEPSTISLSSAGLFLLTCLGGSFRRRYQISRFS